MISVRSSKDSVRRSDLYRMSMRVFYEADRNVDRLLHDEIEVGHVACYTSASYQALHLVRSLRGILIITVLLHVLPDSWLFDGRYIPSAFCIFAVVIFSPQHR